MFQDTGSSRVARVQDILLFLQSPQMEVDRYRVRVERRCCLRCCLRAAQQHQLK